MQEQLNQMLDGCTFMFEQFTYNVAKPAAVAKALEDAGFSAEHVRLLDALQAVSFLRDVVNCAAAGRSSIVNMGGRGGAAVETCAE